MSRKIQSEWERITASTQFIQKVTAISSLIANATKTTDNEFIYDGSFFVYESNGKKRKVKQAHGSFADDAEQNVDQLEEYFNEFSTE